MFWVTFCGPLRNNFWTFISHLVMKIMYLVFFRCGIKILKECLYTFPWIPWTFDVDHCLVSSPFWDLYPFPLETSWKDCSWNYGEIFMKMCKGSLSRQLPSITWFLSKKIKFVIFENWTKFLIFDLLVGQSVWLEFFQQVLNTITRHIPLWCCTASVVVRMWLCDVNTWSKDNLQHNLLLAAGCSTIVWSS